MAKQNDDDGGYTSPRWRKPQEDKPAGASRPAPRPRPDKGEEEGAEPSGSFISGGGLVNIAQNPALAGVQQTPIEMRTPTQYTRPVWNARTPATPFLNIFPQPTTTPWLNIFGQPTNSFTTSPAKPTGLTTMPLNQRPRWSNGLAPAGEAGRPFQPSVTGYNFKPTKPTGGDGGYSSGYGSGYKYKGGGGGGYSDRGYAQSEKIPSWLMNLYNWQFKG